MAGRRGPEAAAHVLELTLWDARPGNQVMTRGRMTIPDRVRVLWLLTNPERSQQLSCGGRLYGWEVRLIVNGSQIASSIGDEVADVHATADEWRRRMLVEGWN